jgi:hypothetical protein
LLLSAAACGGSGSRSTTLATPNGQTAPGLRELALLPDRAKLRGQIVIGDLAAVRRSYRASSSFTRALDEVWLPDALAAIDAGDLWPRTFGFGAGEVSSFAAAGFHPAEVAVVTGRFSEDSIRTALIRQGYHRDGKLLSRGADGSIDPNTPAGRLVLSALDRVLVTESRLVGASTTSLAEDAGSPRSMAADPDISLAARALGEITAAVIKPVGSIQPPAGAVVTPIARNRARWIAAGIDDRGIAGRTVKIVLVYAQPSEAKADAAVFVAKFPKTELLNRSGTRFGQILRGLRVGITEGRAVVVTGKVRAGERPGLWRSLVEGGELALLIALS